MIRLFSQIFINNNYKHLKLRINGKEVSLKKKIKRPVKSIEFVNFECVNNMNYMFANCKLEKIPNIRNWNTSNVTSMNGVFQDCCNLKKIPDFIKFWNTNSVTTMRNMFARCTKIKTVPDISNWNLFRCNDVSGMFENCTNLVKLPDISNWKINTVQYMYFMFLNCNSLVSLPDISKWQVDCDSDLGGMFCGCSSLASLPDLSKWNVLNCRIDQMFKNCASLITLPNLSNWKNALIYTDIFYGCISLCYIDTNMHMVEDDYGQYTNNYLINVINIKDVQSEGYMWGKYDFL